MVGRIFGQLGGDVDSMEWRNVLYGSLDLGWRLSRELEAGRRAMPSIMRPVVLDHPGFDQVPEKSRPGLDLVFEGLLMGTQSCSADQLVQLRHSGRLALQRDPKLLNTGSILASLKALDRDVKGGITANLGLIFAWHTHALILIPAGKPLAEQVQRLVTPLSHHGESKHAFTLALCCALAGVSDELFATLQDNAFDAALTHLVANHQ